MERIYTALQDACVAAVPGDVGGRSRRRLGCGSETRHEKSLRVQTIANPKNNSLFSGEQITITQ